MREILFRGQCQATKEWVYGLPVTESTLSNTVSHIAQFAGENRKFGRTNVKIIPETVSQFTGLIDKNGNKIFEGDIVQTENSKGSVHLDEQYLHYYILYEDDSECLDISFEKEIEIIGNIHEDGDK